MRNIPDELIEDTKFYIDGNKDNKNIEFVVLFGENKELVKKTASEVSATFEDLGLGYGIIGIPAKDFMKIQDIQGIQYIELPKVFVTSDMVANNASCIVPAWNNYGLTGKGVLIGFIDTGIDFRHPVFVTRDKKTRIKYIYNLANGKIYTEEEINKALETGSESIVPTIDYVGHGTAVASVAAGGGSESDKENYGVAFESSIIMVKTTGEGAFTSALSTQILRGLKFLNDKSIELNMPLVVNISLSSNDGAHNGRSLIERYIYEYSQIQRVTVVVAAGNEGSAGHHFSSVIKDEKDVYINVGGGERSITLQMYKPTLTDVNLEIIAPDGGRTGIVEIMLGARRRETPHHKYVFYYSGPKPFDRGGEISITITPKETDVLEGQWILKVYNTSDYDGTFDIWLPVSEELSPQTMFLEPDPFNTLGIPATVESVISVGSYNASGNNYSYFSGRGVERVGRLIKPDFLAPGENINAAMVGGFFGPETGTSVAAPQVAGACALLIEWGIIKENAPYLFGEKVKYYFIKGAKRNPSYPNIYPSKTYGFGYLCLAQAIEVAVKDKEDIQEAKKELLSEDKRGDYMRKKNKYKKEKSSISVVGNNITTNEEVKETSPVKTNKLNETNSNQIIQQLPEIIKKFGSTSNINENNNNTYMEKIGSFMQSTDKQYYLEKGFTDFLVQYDGDLIPEIEKMSSYASAFAIDQSYAIVSARNDKIQEVTNIKEIVYVDSGGVYTLQGVSPSDASKSMNFEYNPYFNLTGKGILVGIIDTGIDFLNNEFIRADNTTTIYRIWDQSLPIETKTGKAMGIGIEYTEDDINKALMANIEKKDPYKIVETIDENGHGTAMAGLIGGRGLNNSIKGIVPDAKIAMVKIKPGNKEFKELYASADATEYQFRNTDIMLGIKYLFDLAKLSKMPMVVYIPLGTTIGGHDGKSVIERFIDNLSDSSGIIFVTSTGNEGTGQNHTSGKLAIPGERKTVELEVGNTQTELFMSIYGKAPDKLGLSIKSPSGEIVENISPKLKSGVNVSFIYEGTIMNIMFIDPSELTGDPVIVISATKLKPGIWSFTLIGEYIVDGTFDCWLLQRELLDKNTKFLMPTPDLTLTIPATARSIIPVGSYNQNNDAILVSSGRGLTRDKRQAPILVAGGYNTEVAGPRNIKNVMSGGSIAGAVITGCCCQLLQWGIIDGNDTTMYASKVRTYFMRATRQRKGDVYPNTEFGYGMIDMSILFNNLQGVSIGNSKSGTQIKNTNRDTDINFEQTDKNEMEEFVHKGLFIRKPINKNS
ncbi:MAG: S8 family serine peptidase [Sarcina sp.]